MRKMYFAMIPKRSFLESAAIAVGVGAGLIYGAQRLLGKEQFDSAVRSLKNRVFDSGAKEFDAPPVPESGENVFAAEDEARARDEQALLERIRRAASRGLDKIESRL